MPTIRLTLLAILAVLSLFPVSLGIVVPLSPRGDTKDPKGVGTCWKAPDLPGFAKGVRLVILRPARITGHNKPNQLAECGVLARPTSELLSKQVPQIGFDLNLKSPVSWQVISSAQLSQADPTCDVNPQDAEKARAALLKNRYEIEGATWLVLLQDMEDHGTEIEIVDRGSKRAFPIGGVDPSTNKVCLGVFLDSIPDGMTGAAFGTKNQYIVLAFYEVSKLIPYLPSPGPHDMSFIMSWTNSLWEATGNLVVGYTWKGRKKDLKDSSDTSVLQQAQMYFTMILKSVPKDKWKGWAEVYILDTRIPEGKFALDSLPYGISLPSEPKKNYNIWVGEIQTHKLLPSDLKSDIWADKVGELTGVYDAHADMGHAYIIDGNPNPMIFLGSRGQEDVYGEVITTPRVPIVMHAAGLGLKKSPQDVELSKFTIPSLKYNRGPHDRIAETRTKKDHPRTRMKGGDHDWTFKDAEKLRHDLKKLRDCYFDQHLRV